MPLAVVESESKYKWGLAMHHLSLTDGETLLIGIEGMGNIGFLGGTWQHSGGMGR